jgi:hypothetical protein
MTTAIPQMKDGLSFMINAPNGQLDEVMTGGLKLNFRACLVVRPDGRGISS